MTDAHVAETRARESEANFCIEDPYYSRFRLFRKRIARVSERHRGTCNFRRRAGKRDRCVSLLKPQQRHAVLVEPAIYRNRKIANKGSLALCSVVSFLRYIKGENDRARRGVARARVDGSSRFSRDAKFISSE